MKLEINKKLRIALMSLLIILISISSVLLFRELKIPSYEKQTIPVYTYSNKAWAKPTVFLKPNNLYKENSLGEGKVYITEFVDYIKAEFNYEFSGERDADIKGNYDIVAKIQGFTGDDDDFINIWEREYIIVNKKSLNIKGTSKSIKEEVKLNIEPYNNFAAEVKEAAKINSQTMLTLVMNINLKGETDKGPIEDTISPSLIIPLESAIFEIGGNKTIEEDKFIEEDVDIQIPVSSKQVIFYGIIIGALVLILLFLIFLVKTAPDRDPHERMLKKIFKHHGSRLVALNSELILDKVNVIYVKSIDDLVRTADEIGKPILYKHSDDYSQINLFYISNGKQVYILDISKAVVKEEIDTSDDLEVEESAGK